ncbi:MAG: recombination protein RecR [Parcubacteria group bacterium Gr01-1014_46]|nr:MAG: recombination protein RecR [Parcubacteria group bacterium Gr01-1014_46]
MDNTQKLIELFKEFPGIGPRQAKRFVYFLLNKNPAYANDIAGLIKEVRSTVHSCDTCFRFFPVPTGRQANGNSNTCPTCRDTNRDAKSLMIVSHDVDFENIEKTKFFNGYYFVLGGTVPILEKTPEKRIRQKDLLETIEKRIKNKLSEIILALNYNPEGENTLSYLTEVLKPLTDKNNIKISTLGRGLSTGTELEYSDSDTIKNALKNRQ